MVPLIVLSEDEIEIIEDYQGRVFCEEVQATVLVLSALVLGSLSFFLFALFLT